MTTSRRLRRAGLALARRAGDGDAAAETATEPVADGDDGAKEVGKFLRFMLRGYTYFPLEFRTPERYGRICGFLLAVSCWVVKLKASITRAGHSFVDLRTSVEDYR